MKICSYNVNGLRACIRNGGIGRIMDLPWEVLCLQEIKCTAPMVPQLVNPGEFALTSALSSKKAGYAGVATIMRCGLIPVKIEPFQTPEELSKKSINTTGRIIQTEFREFYLINVYTLNSGGKDDLRRDWDNWFRSYIKGLQTIKPVVIMGDLNVVPSRQDYYGDWSKAVQFGNMAGMKTYEINGFNDLIQDCKLIDSFRLLNPTTRQYSWFTYRAGARESNHGWRLDFALVDERLKSKIKSSEIYSDITGSDHCPILLDIDAK